MFVGILVYIQTVGPQGNDPLNSPPTREIKKVEIKKIVEGFELSNASTNSVAGGAFMLEEFNNTHNTHNEVDLHLAQSEHNDVKDHNNHNKKQRTR